MAEHGDQGRPQAIDPGSLPAAAWSTGLRVRFGHCDAAGIVFTPRYFDMYIEAMELWYEEALGFTLRDLILRRRIGLGYAEAWSTFFQPSVFGDRLSLTLIVETVGRSSFDVTVHASAVGQERARGRLVSVATDLNDGKVVPLPQDVRDGLVAYRERCEIIAG